MLGAVTKTVVVVGLGKIGLPLAAQYASKGMSVIGCDVLPEVVDTINSGHSHIREETGLEDAIAAAVRQKRLRATTDTTAAVKEADVTVVIVPLMVGRERDTDYRSIDADRGRRRGSRGALVIHDDAAGGHHAPALDRC
jgi:UDP-N-acetyl-D-mannosaminuronate dehydrogenase